MEIWAAIDLHGGRAVTPVQGRIEKRMVWKEDPVALAGRWEEGGAYGLHVIDLDAAFETGSNMKVVEAILRRSTVPVQLGGGVRSFEDVRQRLAKGIDRVILGTLAFREPSTLSRILGAFSEEVVVAADYRDGVIVTRAWRQKESLGIMEAIGKLQNIGVKNVLATSVGFEGMNAGPDVQMIKKICRSTKMRILASGGIRNLKDVEELQKAGSHGVVLGRALFEGTVTLAEAKKVGQQ